MVGKVTIKPFAVVDYGVTIPLEANTPDERPIASRSNLLVKARPLAVETFSSLLGDRMA